MVPNMATQMPNIVMASPRNNPQQQQQMMVQQAVPGTGVSIERINKNISDSINQGKGPTGAGGKEIQLIQAYQH